MIGQPDVRKERAFIGGLVAKHLGNQREGAVMLLYAFVGPASGVASKGSAKVMVPL